MDPKSVLELAAKNNAKIFDLRFADLPGLWQHTSYPIGELDEGSFQELQIVGVVGDVVQGRAEEGPRPAVYLPYTQSEWPIANVIVRSNQDLKTLGPEIRRAAARFSPIVPIRDCRPPDNETGRRRRVAA